MFDLLRRAGVAALALERARRLGELVEDRAVRGLESPTLGGRQAFVGEGESAQVLERSARSREALLEPSGERADLAFRGSHGRERILEQAATRLVARARADRAHEREGFAPLEAVSLDRGDDQPLGRARDSAERESESDADCAGIDARGDRRLERAREGESARDPFEPPAAERRDPARAELLLDAERMDDARLVHDGERALRRVRLEEEHARRRARPRSLEDDRDLARALGAPALEPLEPVDHFVAAVRERDDAERKLRELVAAPRTAAPKRRETGLELFESDVLDTVARRGGGGLEEGCSHDRAVRSALAAGAARRHREHLPPAVDRVRRERPVCDQIERLELGECVQHVPVREPELAADPGTCVPAHALVVRREAEERVDRHRLGAEHPEPVLILDPRVDPPERRPLWAAHAVSLDDDLAALLSARAHARSSRRAAEGKGERVYGR
jgi:hypothetical protein